jgi:hypothetical protein
MCNEIALSFNVGTEQDLKEVKSKREENGRKYTGPQLDQRIFIISYFPILQALIITNHPYENPRKKLTCQGKNLDASRLISLSIQSMKTNKFLRIVRTSCEIWLSCNPGCRGHGLPQLLISGTS